jgi:AraC-like DNA-binding protein
MISLDRLLNGLSVSVDNVVLDDPREPPLDRARASQVNVRSPPSGGNTLELVGGAVIRFTPEKVTVFPPRSRARPNGDPTARRAGRRNGANEPSRIGRRLRVSYLGSVGLFDQLREPLVQELRRGDPIARSLRELVEEISAQRPGRRVMMESLLQRSLVLLLRRCCAPDGRVPWMAALQDVGIGRAVSAMRDQPEHSFSLQGLADVAGMSRSVFAARFSESVERSPMEFLKEVRLDRAAELLTRTDLPVKAIAARVGYSSRSSFTRAFLASHRVGPTAFREEGRELVLDSARPSVRPPRVGKDRRKGDRRRSAHRRTAPRGPAH